MAAEVKKLDPPKPPAPDGTKPIAMAKWYVPYNQFSGAGMTIVVGGGYADGLGTNGKVKSITYYPGTSSVIVEIETGYLPGVLQSAQEVGIGYAVFTGGHGRAL